MPVVRPNALISPLRRCYNVGSGIAKPSARPCRLKVSPRPSVARPTTQKAQFMHTSPSLQAARIQVHESEKRPPHPATVHRDENVGQNRFADFDLKGRVFVVTGGAQGLGLALAEGLVEAGGKVYCLDRADKPTTEYNEALARVVPEWGGSLNYMQQDVTDEVTLDRTIASIADEHQRLDGVVAAAGIQHLCPAVDFKAADIERVLRVNFTGVLLTASAAARQMLKYKSHGSMVFIASMSGLIANKGLPSSVYNSSKAAVIQLARNLAMEWSPIDKETGAGGIRVNCISPGHIVTPMVQKHFDETPELKTFWESENPLGRLAQPSDFKGAVLYLLSRASGFTNGSNMVIDGGHTIW
ncbi:hypothetical protein SLS53_008397 [Cytospora paraplurivora]|uniref:Ketoreductase domain-containing protein n=1 Tax=Cytospora paraplurivora TaxID=2898453 RepID=A0AAN9YD10_9PEZI